MMLRRNIKARAEKSALKRKAATPKAKPKVEPKAEPVEESVAVEAKEVVWTAEEIQKMPYMKLKSVAKKNGVDVAEKEAADIRSELIEKLGL